MLSNLTAGDREQVAAVCAAGVVPKLLDMAAHEEYEIKKEVVYALCNACCFGSAQIVCTRPPPLAPGGTLPLPCAPGRAKRAQDFEVFQIPK